MPLYRNNWISNAFWIGLFIAFCGSSVTYNAWRILLHRHDYRRAIFAVASVSYYSDDGIASWSAHGRIGDAEEDMSLHGVIPTPHNQEDLESLVPVGTQFDVWYDPSAIANFETQFVYLRVLPRELNDFDGALGYAVLVTAVWNGLPLVTGGIIAGSFIRSRFFGAST